VLKIAGQEHPDRHRPTEGIKQWMAPAVDTQLNQLFHTQFHQKLRQEMSISSASGKAKDHLLFYGEICKLHALDQPAQDIDVAQHIGKSRKSLWHNAMPAKHFRDNEYLLYWYR
jgi:hypothetical protein